MDEDEQRWQRTLEEYYGEHPEEEEDEGSEDMEVANINHGINMEELLADNAFDERFDIWIREIREEPDWQFMPPYYMHEYNYAIALRRERSEKGDIFRKTLWAQKMAQKYLNYHEEAHRALHYYRENDPNIWHEASELIRLNDEKLARINKYFLVLEKTLFQLIRSEEPPLDSVPLWQWTPNWENTRRYN